MFIYIAYLPYRYYYYNSSFTNLLIANIDSFSNLDNLIYIIPAPIPAKLAKITLAICRIAAYKAKRRDSAKAHTTAGRAVAAKRPKKEGLRRSKRTTSGNVGRYTTNSGLIADKDDNNAYNRAYIPPANIEKKEGSSSDNNGVNGSTSDSANKGKGSGVYKRGKGTLYYKDTPLLCPIIARYLKVLIASKPTSAQSTSSNTTTKLSRDFYSKEGPRPLTTTSTTIVGSRNGKGSSRTSIINSSLVPIGFSNSDFIEDKATSKSTYGYLYKLASRPLSWKTKRATTIALSTLEAETDGLTEAIREVQWIIGLFSKLHRPIDHPITLYRDNQGSITVANNPALHARTKHTILKFRYVREQVKAKIVTILYLNTNLLSGF
ncbi:hypothetical protein P8C59_000960 [Phyllachora maydis]|uniref:Uncharacterized protein n=1 Tax=Phyllachora maydis TaxID=1825666 RepID=A0AAD9MBS2_9PEZI|nr:hypothetical protein P8C59_000960 [Phyllachora maydis]